MANFGRIDVCYDRESGLNTSGLGRTIPQFFLTAEIFGLSDEETEIENRRETGRYEITVVLAAGEDVADFGVNAFNNLSTSERPPARASHF